MLKSKHKAGLSPGGQPRFGPSLCYLRTRFDVSAGFTLPGVFLAFFCAFCFASLATHGAECLRVDFEESGSDAQWVVILTLGHPLGGA